MRDTRSYFLVVFVAIALGLAACAVVPPKSASTGCNRCHDAAATLPPSIRPWQRGASRRASPATYPTRIRSSRTPSRHGCTGRIPGREWSAPPATACGPTGASACSRCPRASATLDLLDLGRVKRAMESWATFPFLSGTHGVKRNLMCGACHAKQLIPDDNETTLNRRCVACHGTNAQVSAKLKARLNNPHIDPHAVAPRGHRLYRVPPGPCGLEGLLPGVSHQFRHADSGRRQVLSGRRGERS